MKTIVYYISDNGFGHATRGIGLIRELASYQGVEIIVKTSRPLQFIKDSLSEFENIRYVYSENDVGLILENNSLEIDCSQLKIELKNWVDNWDELVSAEASWLKENKIDLVISDITPWAFLAAEKADIKSLAVSNFTWYEVYRDLLGGDAPLIEEIAATYKKVDLFFQLSLSLPMENSNQLQEFDFISRRIDNSRVREIKEDIDSSRKLAYVGVGKSVDPEILASLNFEESSEYNWLFSAGVSVQGNNIYKISETATETQNYIAACDYVITKPGWSTVAESILANNPLLLINRDQVIEDRIIRKKVENLDLGMSILEEEFWNLEFKSKLDQLDNLDANFDNYDNQVGKLGRKIISFL